MVKIPEATSPGRDDPGLTGAPEDTEGCPKASPESSSEGHRMLGVTLQPLSMTDLNNAVEAAVTGGHRLVIANHNAHSVYLYHHVPEYRRFFNEVADLIHVDGMSLILAARLLGLPFGRRHRTTYVDWILPLMELAAEIDAKVYHLGGREGVEVRARSALQGKIPRLNLVCHHGFFDHRPDSDDNRRVLEEINTYSPDILLVGMGMPLQERWIADSYHELDARVFLPCGACMDYVAGAVPTPPRWLARLGFEWLARMTAEPGRLWKRYLIEPWYLAALFSRDLLRRRRG